MSTQFTNEPDDDDSSLWNKDPGPGQYLVVSRSRRWLVPALVSTLVFVLVLAFGISSGRLSSRLGSLEDKLSNISLSLSAAQKESGDVAKSLQRLKFSVETNKDHLSSVAESLKQLVVVDSLSKAVTSLKCALELYIHNKTQSAGCCPVNWDRFESSCFFFSKTTLSWHEARDWCHAHQSQLLILATDKDWDYVRPHVRFSFHWVGLTDERGKWEWVNGTPYTIDRRRWKPGQPDNWDGHGLGEGTEDCAHLHLDGRLNDLHCSERLRYICRSHGEQS